MVQIWNRKLSAKKNIEIIDLPFKNTLIFFFLFNLVLIIIILLIQNMLPPQIPLFYGLAEGEEQLVFRIWLILPSLVTLLVMIINSLIAFTAKDVFIKKSLIVSLLALSILTITTTFKIAFLVGNF
jgi:hypothetical protein